MNASLDDYIKNQLIEGKPPGDIRKVLLEKGWDKQAIETSLRPYKRTSFGKFFALPNKFNKKPILIVLIIFLAGIVSFGSLYGYLYYYLDPNQILTRSLSNFSNIKAYSFSGTLRTEYDKPQNETSLQTPISFSSAFTGTYVNTTVDGPRYGVSFTVNAGSVNVAQLEARKISSRLYLFPKQLSDLGLINNERILNKWIEIDTETFPVKTPNFISVFSSILSGSEKKKLLGQISQSPPLIITTTLPDDTIEGVPSYHFLYIVQKDNLVSLLKRQENAQENEIDRLFSQIDFKNGEIWIARKGNYINRITILFVRKGAERNTPGLNVALDIRLTDIANQKSIPIPEDSIPLTRIILEMTNEFNDKRSRN